MVTESMPNERGPYKCYVKLGDIWAQKQRISER